MLNLFQYGRNLFLKYSNHWLLSLSSWAQSKGEEEGNESRLLAWERGACLTAGRFENKPSDPDVKVRATSLWPKGGAFWFSHCCHSCEGRNLFLKYSNHWLLSLSSWAQSKGGVFWLSFFGGCCREEVGGINRHYEHACSRQAKWSNLLLGYPYLWDCFVPLRHAQWSLAKTLHKSYLIILFLKWLPLSTEYYHPWRYGQGLPSLRLPLPAFGMAGRFVQHDTLSVTILNY